jgi:PAS domain S-box-containing protein
VDGGKTVPTFVLQDLSMNDFFAHPSLCESIVDQSSVAIVFGDREGIIRLWNTGAETMFGWTAGEAIGKSMDMIIPEKHRERHWEGYDRVMETGVTKYGQSVLAVPASTKDGRRISIEFNVVLLKDADGRVLGVAATMQDVTARWEQDKALRTRLAELEAKLKQAGVLTENKS